ncbi:spore germination protein [Heyndrickxia sporothermodurans]|uniref:spore germination protein n=1 Tax=Heyndrickxia sporothermodurans TaxID=46224 RepID=UPI002DBA3706|nr:spore germination protein [Heyndrickxia sporothermodurans]MEB6547633.1 spore germination protein [Heyndrickxia sporothermodurans]
MTNDLNRKEPIPKNIEELEKIFEKRIGLGVSFDLGVRHIKVLKKNIQIYYINGLTDTLFIIHILRELVDLNGSDRLSSKIYDIIQNRIVNQSVEVVKTIDEMADQVLSGLIAIVVEGEGEAIIVDVRSYPGRQPMEPDTEKVVRGSRDGYVENIIINTALTRRRIRDERLRFEIMKVGERSKTDVAIGYIEGVANPDFVKTVKKELKTIDVDGITMADKTIEEFLLKQGYNPYPLVRYTERADVGSIHLLEGHVLIFIDTSPSVMVTPATFFHHLQHAEEYRQSAAVGTFIRWVRYLGVLASIFLLPLWYLFAIEPSLLPEHLEFIGPNKQTNIPLILQIFIADMGIEFLRIAAIHTPTPLATAMGLIAAVLIGQIAVDVGLFVSEVILYVSVAAIGTYATPSYELSVANKIAKVVLMLLVAFFKLPGLLIGGTLFVIYLAHIRALNAPYLWPFIPFNPQAITHILIRRTVPGSKIRPSIVHPRDRFRQPADK